MHSFRMKILILVSLAGLAGVNAFTQQDPQFSHNMFNHLAVNPGFAGSQGMLSAGMINRQQWMGFEGNPKTTLFTVHTPVKPFGIPSGVGLSFMDDRLGFEKNMSFILDYAYRLELGKGKLGIGLNIGMLSRALNGKWVIPDSDNHIPASQDPSIPDEQVTSMTFDMGIGVFYNTDKLYAGFSSTHLLEPLVDFGSGAMMHMQRHYYATAGYLFKLSNPIFEIQPSIFAKSDGASFQMDVNMLLLYNKRFWGGVSYRLGDAVVVMVGTELPNGLRVGISYDFTTSAIGAYSNGTVEFMLGYNLEVGTDKFSQRYKSVRFL
ncbi:MAG: type IX secretion system membrane protein PorP/SprF [Porphyromonadaceae bacterium]|nr:MAG: type IX secretion system membrane protein PorP/SprF [Porphyromonadaceae bacterium]